MNDIEYNVLRLLPPKKSVLVSDLAKNMSVDLIHKAMNTLCNHERPLVFYDLADLSLLITEIGIDDLEKEKQKRLMDGMHKDNFDVLNLLVGLVKDVDLREEIQYTQLAELNKTKGELDAIMIELQGDGYIEFQKRTIIAFWVVLTLKGKRKTQGDVGSYSNSPNPIQKHETKIEKQINVSAPVTNSQIFQAETLSGNSTSTNTDTNVMSEHTISETKQENKADWWNGVNKKSFFAALAIAFVFGYIIGAYNNPKNVIMHVFKEVCHLPSEPTSTPAQ